MSRIKRLIGIENVEDVNKDYLIESLTRAMVQDHRSEGKMGDLAFKQYLLDQAEKGDGFLMTVDEGQRIAQAMVLTDFSKEGYIQGYPKGEFVDEIYQILRARDELWDQEVFLEMMRYYLYSALEIKKSSKNLTLRFNMYLYVEEVLTKMIRGEYKTYGFYSINALCKMALGNFL
jgi:hypothetical protein